MFSRKRIKAESTYNYMWLDTLPGESMANPENKKIAWMNLWKPQLKYLYIYIYFMDKKYHISQASIIDIFRTIVEVGDFSWERLMIIEMFSCFSDIFYLQFWHKSCGISPRWYKVNINYCLCIQVVQLSQ